MKKILMLFFLMAIIGCKSTQRKKSPTVAKETTSIEEPAFVIMPLDKVSAPHQERAYEVGKRILNTCNTSRFKPFSAIEATENVIRNSTQERLTKTCHNFRLKYGSFKDLELIQVIRDTKNQSYVFRFKALYSKQIANKELRVTINEMNQASAIKSLDWTDEFQ
jgi:hypothetical protein